MNPNLDSFLIIDSSDHLDTHFSNLVEGGLLQTDVSQDFNNPLPHTDACVLKKAYKPYTSACVIDFSLTRKCIKIYNMSTKFNFTYIFVLKINL